MNGTIAHITLYPVKSLDGIDVPAAAFLESGPLEDDRRLQPVEHVTPVIRAETVSRLGPGIEQVVNEVSAALTTKELRSLNAEVSLGADPAAVAASWLAANGLVEDLG